MEQPKERLRRWVEEQGGASAAALLIGCDRSFLTHLLREARRRPGLDTAFAIQRATKGWAGGQIRAQEWTPDAAEAS